jgi:hypothetical protein
LAVAPIWAKVIKASHKRWSLMRKSGKGLGLGFMVGGFAKVNGFSGAARSAQARRQPLPAHPKPRGSSWG